MNELRRQKITKVMAIVLVAFGGSLLYFLFFNSGLNVLSDPSDPVGHVLVLNDSVHAIRSITFSYLVGNKKMGERGIDILLPRESESIELDSRFIENGSYTLQVSAPYHLSRQIVVQAGSLSQVVPAISVTLEVDPVGTQNKPVSIRLSGKSLDSLSLVVSASLELGDSSWGVNPPVSEWGLSPDGESSVVLSFTPLVARENLSFKIRVFTPSNVLVEREYSILVLPNVDVNTMNLNVSDENVVADTNALLDVNSSADTNKSTDVNGSVS